MKLKSVLLGLLGAIAIAAPVKAQSYEPFPLNEDCPIVINRVCHDNREDGSPIFFAVPTGYNSRYLLTASRTAQGGNLIFMYDILEDQVAAYIYVNNQGVLMSSLNGRPAIGGNIDMLQDIQEEYVDMLILLMRY